LGFGEPVGNLIEAAENLSSLLDLLTVFLDNHPQIAGDEVVPYPLGRWGRDTWGHFRWG